MCDGNNCHHTGICGIKDIRCLQVDHIYGDGSIDKENMTSNKEMFRYYVKHPDIAKERLQPLCANCNWIKRHNNKEYRGAEAKENSLYKKCIVDTCKKFAAGRRKFCPYHQKLMEKTVPLNNDLSTNVSGT